MSDGTSSSSNSTLATTNKRSRNSSEGTAKSKGSKKKSKTLTSFFANASSGPQASTVHSNNGHSTVSSSSSSPVMKAFPGADLNLSPGAGNGRRLPLKNQIRRIEIKNLNLPAPSKRIEYIKTTSEKLRNALDAILHDRQTDFALEHLYKCVMNLCQDRVADQVWQDCLDAMTRYIDGQVEPLESRCTGSTDHELVLHEIFTSWSNWTLKLKFIRNVYFYLDRDYLYNKVSREPMWETGVKLFSKRVLHRPAIEQSLGESIFELLVLLRSGENGGNTHQRLRSTWDMMSSNESDERWFVEKFYEGSSLYYGYVDCDETMSLSQHVNKITRQLEIEDEICTKVFNFDANIQRRASLAMQVSLLKTNDRYKIVFLKMHELFAKGGLEDARLLFEYMTNVGVTGELRQKWHECVKQKCEDILAASDNHDAQSGDIVLALIKLYDESREITHVGFKRNSEFEKSWREAFEVLDKKSQYIADALEKHIDRVLRSSKEPMYAHALEGEMQFVVELLRFIPGKDYFRVAHERDLARRQLRRGFAGLEDELSMISYLKNEFGSSYTENMEAMMKDIQTSNDDMDVLKGLLDQRDFEFSATLVSKKWPSFGNETYIITKEMTEMIEQFEGLYKSKYPRRLVTWQHGQGSMTIRARLPSCGTKEIATSQVQGLILLLFNDRDSLDYEQVRSALAAGTDNNDDDNSGLIKRSLLSLTHGKVKILTKTPDTREIHRADIFELNKSLKVKSHKIRIPMLQMPRAAHDAAAAAAARVQEIEQQVNRDRSYEMQAAATRIMKARKQLRHGELVQLVIEQMRDRGQVVVADVKKCIEGLIQDEFFARNADDPDVYDYIA